MADRVCLIATVRSPLNELLEFTRYHLAAGVDKVILFFDDPNDTAVNSITSLPQVVPIVCDTTYWDARRTARPEAVEHRQIVNVNFGMQIARADRCDWVIHIDGDELLLAQDTVGAVLAGYSADLVRFDMKEAVAEQDYYASRFQATLFRVPLSAAGSARLAALSPAETQDILFEGEYFRAHTASKVAVRLGSHIKRMGIHGPERQRMPEVQTSQIVLLHYDCIGIDDWRRKWLRRIDASGTAAGMRPARTKQLDLFKQAYGDESKERDLYSRLHKVSEQQKQLLLTLGLLQVITLSPEMMVPGE